MVNYQIKLIHELKAKNVKLNKLINTDYKHNIIKHHKL